MLFFLTHVVVLYDKVCVAQEVGEAFNSECVF